MFRLVRPEDFNGKEGTLLAKLISEFIGTYLLVVTVGFNVLTGSTAAAFSIAACLMCMIYSLGGVSGAHFNPAVTFSIWLSGRNQISVMDALYYVLTQLVAGACAGLTYVSVMQRSFPLAPGAGYNWFGVFIAETIFTAVLCFVVLSVATTQEKKAPEFVGLAIGSCVTVGGFAIGGISGGSLNPAVSFGVDAANLVKGGSFMNSLVYTALELGGAAGATGLFYLTQPDEYKKLPSKTD
jgi:aquaporin Z